MKNKSILKFAAPPPAGNIFFQIASELMRSLSFLIIEHILSWIFPLTPVRTGIKTPVVLIPGFWGKSWGFRRLRKALKRNGYSVFAPEFGFQVGDIHKKACKLDQYLKTNRLDDYYLVCHSMGGVIAWDFLNRNPEKIRKWITLGTPFHGTATARFFKLFKGASQLVPGSSWLKELHRTKTPMDKLIAIYTNRDEIVIPAQSAFMDKGERICLPVAGHLNLFQGKMGIEAILACLDYFDKNKE